MKSLVSTREETQLWAVIGEDSATRLTMPIPEILEDVLRVFESVFGDPQDLPPRRDTDHASLSRLEPNPSLSGRIIMATIKRMK